MRRTSAGHGLANIRSSSPVKWRVKQSDWLMWHAGCICLYTQVCVCRRTYAHLLVCVHVCAVKLHAFPHQGQTCSCIHVYFPVLDRSHVTRCSAHSRYSRITYWQPDHLCKAHWNGTNISSHVDIFQKHPESHSMMHLQIFVGAWTQQPLTESWVG